MTRSIRRARVEDAAALASVNVASWRAAYTGLLPDAVLADLDETDLARRWADEIERGNPGVTVWVAEDDASIVAYTRAGPARDPDSIERGGVAEVYGLYVHPRAWSSGLGRALIEHVSHEARAAGRDVLTLNVIESNDRAMSFYERIGFTRDRAASPWFGVPQVRYRKEL